MPSSVRWLPLLALAACAAVTPWETLTFSSLSGPIPGPLNVGDERPYVQRRCTQTLNNHPQCQYAFIDSSQRKVDIFKDLLVSIDGHAEQVAPLRPWVRKANMRVDAREEARFPYRMHLLTVSPAVAAGSFWFTPGEAQGAVHPLPTDPITQEISVGSAVLRLTQDSGRWQVQRLR